MFVYIKPLFKHGFIFYLKSDLYFLYPTMKKLIILFLAISLSGCFLIPTIDRYAKFESSGDKKSLAYCIATSWVFDEYNRSNTLVKITVMEQRSGSGHFSIYEGRDVYDGPETVHVFTADAFTKNPFPAISFFVQQTDFSIPLPERSQRRLELTKKCAEMSPEKRKELFVNKDAPFAMYGDGR